MTPGRKILMIDDDVNLVGVFRLVCTAKGYDFHAAHSAAEGLRRIPEVAPDLIILDVIMEDFVAGFRVLSELPTGESDSPYAAFARTPVIMLTSVTSRTHVNFSQMVGTALLPVDLFIEKPAKPAEILEAIERTLARSEPAPPASA
jgi:CheY-like chemotaxis protein